MRRFLSSAGVYHTQIGNVHGSPIQAYIDVPRPKSPKFSHLMENRDRNNKDSDGQNCGQMFVEFYASALILMAASVLLCLQR